MLWVSEGRTVEFTLTWCVCGGGGGAVGTAAGLFASVVNYCSGVLRCADSSHVDSGGARPVL